MLQAIHKRINLNYHIRINFVEVASKHLIAHLHQGVWWELVILLSILEQSVNLTHRNQSFSFRIKFIKIQLELEMIFEKLEQVAVFEEVSVVYCRLFFFFYYFIY